MAKAKATQRQSINVRRYVVAFLASRGIKFEHGHRSTASEELAVALESVTGVKIPSGRKAHQRYLEAFWKGQLTPPPASVEPRTLNKEPQVGIMPADFVRSPEFYASREWQAVRYKALIRHGRICQCCGAKPGNGVVLHVDHVKPRWHYPELALCLDNLQILCADCNMGKGAWDESDFREAVG